MILVLKFILVSSGRNQLISNIWEKRGSMGRTWEGKLNNWIFRWSRAWGSAGGPWQRAWQASFPQPVSHSPHALHQPVSSEPPQPAQLPFCTTSGSLTASGMLLLFSLLGYPCCALPSARPPQSSQSEPTSPCAKTRPSSLRTARLPGSSEQKPIGRLPLNSCCSPLDLCASRADSYGFCILPAFLCLRAFALVPPASVFLLQAACRLPATSFIKAFSNRLI